MDPRAPRLGPLGATALLIIVGVLAAGCGSSKRETTSSASNGLSPAGVQRAAGAIPPFTHCMTNAGWKVVSPAATEPVLAALRAETGYQALIAVADRHGNRAAVAFFATPQQAAHAQVSVGSKVPGKGHATSTPGVALAWVNYTGSGSGSVDGKVAACGTAAKA